MFQDLLRAILIFQSGPRVDTTGGGDRTPPAGRHVSFQGNGDQRVIQLLLEGGFPVEEAIQVVTLNGGPLPGGRRHHRIR